MLTQEQLKFIDETISKYQQFIITTHVNPDGDGLGSEIALAQYLCQRNRTYRILNSSPAPDVYGFLDPNQEIEIYDADRHVEYVRNADAIFILDISDWGRLNELGNFVKSSRLLKICIDHHPVQKAYADFDVIYPQASSTGELIYELLVGLGARLSQRICEAIYTAILTDTGGFRYSNTTPDVHRIAAELLAHDIDPQQIYREIYENQSPARVRLMAEVLATLRYAFDGQLAYMYISQEMLAKAEATLKDTDGLSDYPRTIRGVEVALLFVELEDGRVKISFRSKGNVVINELARALGGGGHAFASGATVEGRLEDVMRQTVQRASGLFRS